MCSSSARLGYALWSGYDRPSPDHARARFILLLSSHLEPGHYFNPHAQRIIDGKLAGAKLAVMDPRLSNTASMADFWLPTYPGSEAAVLLAMARVLLDEGLADLDYVERWTNWREYMTHRRRGAEPDVRRLRGRAARTSTASSRPSSRRRRAAWPRIAIVEVARLIGAARGAFASHVWRGTRERQPGRLAGRARAAAPDRAHRERGHAGRHVARAPGTSTSRVFWEEPPRTTDWNELLFPQEWPLSHYEMSFLLPHFLKEGRGKLDTYFTRVYNPVWTNPDGMTWVEVLQGRGAGRPPRRAHARPGARRPSSPTTSCPWATRGERHDIQSQETHSGKWVSFRQPVLRAARERRGETFRFTYETNPGEVWEEDEFWIELSWRIDPDGALGIRQLVRVALPRRARS